MVGPEAGLAAAALAPAGLAAGEPAAPDEAAAAAAELAAAGLAAAAELGAPTGADAPPQAASAPPSSSAGRIRKPRIRPLLIQCCALEYPRPAMALQHDEYDFICAGSGAAGLAGALTAAAQGARVLLLEKAERLGGGTAYSYGAMWAGRSEE